MKTTKDIFTNFFAKGVRNNFVVNLLIWIFLKITIFDDSEYILEIAWNTPIAITIGFHFYYFYKTQKFYQTKETQIKNKKGLTISDHDLNRIITNSLILGNYIGLVILVSFFGAVFWFV